MIINVVARGKLVQIQNPYPGYGIEFISPLTLVMGIKF